MNSLFFFFFFQAEDGIRDSSVTGVQTCALPISLALACRADHDAIAGDGDRGAEVDRAPRAGLELRARDRPDAVGAALENVGRPDVAVVEGRADDRGRAGQAHRRAERVVERRVGRVGLQLLRGGAQAVRLTPGRAGAGPRREAAVGAAGAAATDIARAAGEPARRSVAGRAGVR